MAPVRGEDLAVGHSAAAPDKHAAEAIRPESGFEDAIRYQVEGVNQGNV
jgi:hypothetical protein